MKWANFFLIVFAVIEREIMWIWLDRYILDFIRNKNLFDKNKTFKNRNVKTLFKNNAVTK